MILETIPKDTLTFNYDSKIKTMSKEKLTLKNISKNLIAFKIKTTTPEDFIVKPNRGLLKASKTLEIKVQKKFTNEEKKDRFMICFKEMKEKIDFETISKLEEKYPDFWKDLNIQKIKINVFTKNVDTKPQNQEKLVAEKEMYYSFYNPSPSIKLNPTQIISLQDYSIESLLGKSQFPVYKIKNPKTNTFYALKLFEIIADDAEKEKEILSEASLLNQFNGHKSFVSFKGLTKDVKSIPNSKLQKIEYGIMMDLMGSSLEEDIKIRNQANKNHYTLKEISKFIQQTYEGFIFMEQKNYAHRDIKPANILIDDKKNFRISDLGISKVVQGITGTVIGTTNFMSVELMNDFLKDEQSTHCNFIYSDVFSYGLTLLKMLTFENIAGVNLQDGTFKQKKLFDKVQDIYKDSGQKLLLFLEKLLERNPEKRKGFIFNWRFAYDVFKNSVEEMMKEWKIYFDLFDDNKDGLIDSESVLEFLKNFDDNIKEKSIIKAFPLAHLYSFEQFYFYKKNCMTKVLKPWINFLIKISSQIFELTQAFEEISNDPIETINKYDIKARVGDFINFKTKILIDLIFGQSMEKNKGFSFPELKETINKPQFIIKFKVKKNPNEFLEKLQKLIDYFLIWFSHLEAQAKDDKCFQHLLISSKHGYFMNENEVFFYLCIEPFLENLTVQLDDCFKKIMGDNYDGFLKIWVGLNFTTSEFNFNQPFNILDLLGKGFEINVKSQLPEKTKIILDNLIEKKTKEDENAFMVWEFLNNVELSLKFKSLEEFLKRFPSKSSIINSILSEYSKDECPIQILKKGSADLNKENLKNILELLSLINSEISLIFKMGKFSLSLGLDLGNIEDLIQELR